MSTAALKVTSVLDDRGAMNVKQLVTATRLSELTVRGALHQLKRRGYIQSFKENGQPAKYATTDKEYTGAVTRYRLPAVCIAPDGTEREFESIAACADALGVPKKNLWSYVRNGWKCREHSVRLKS